MMSDEQNKLADEARAEILSRHSFFVDWLTGRADDGALEQSARAFHPHFTRVGPDGEIQNRTAVIDALAAARGVHRQDLQIEITFEDQIAVGDEAVLIHYVEHQSTAERRTTRRSSALFLADQAAPRGAVWRFLHETWTEPRSDATQLS